MERFKGKFIKKKVLLHKLIRSEGMRLKQKQWRELKNNVLPYNYPCTGCRIINLKILSINTICKNCQSILWLGNIEEEKIYGLNSVLYIKCQKCSMVQLVSTSDNHAVNEYAKPFLDAKQHNDITTNVVLGKD